MYLIDGVHLDILPQYPSNADVIVIKRWAELDSILSSIACFSLDPAVLFILKSELSTTLMYFDYFSVWILWSFFYLFLSVAELEPAEPSRIRTFYDGLCLRLPLFWQWHFFIHGGRSFLCLMRREGQCFLRMSSTVRCNTSTLECKSVASNLAQQRLC